MVRLIKIRVLPRSSIDEVVGEMENGVLKIKLKVAPVDGEANIALTKLLAKHFGVGRDKIEIVRGMRSKDKVVKVDGLR